MKTKKLKIAGLLMCLAAVTMMVSCNDEERMTRKLVGTWAYVGADFEGTDGSYYLSHGADEKGRTVTFNDDGTVEGDLFIRGAFQIDKYSRWSIIGDSLYIKTLPYEIQQLTHSNLKILARLYDGNASLEFIKQ